ncbi:MAG: dihydrolipoyllysine-residue succinyltransferase [Simkaniaceae bacterium]|nr:dihydrolipoyllysine-residue succinyltransferase [Simkaniaceae bacterium]
MKVDIPVPPFGESVSEAIVANIMKKTGERVEKDEEILELETDKVSGPVTAPEAGVLTLNVNVDDVVSMDAILGSIDTEGAAVAAPPAEKPAAVEPPKEAAPPPPASLPNARSSAEDYVASLETPAAPAPSTPPPVQKPAAAPKSTPGATRTRMSGLRRTIAKRLVEAKNTTAMLTTFNEVDLTKIIAIRKNEKDQFIEKHGVKLGFMSFFIRACVQALKAFPNVNAQIDGEEIVAFDSQHIAVAVSTDRGLMVPVLRDCQDLSFAEIEATLGGFAKKARENKISVDDMQGGTFTITNGGVFGSLISTPIINTPQSAILGMHAIKERPIAVNGKVEIRPMMYLALSYDHRIIDGRESVQFLVHLKENLEDPERLLLDF